MGKQWQAKNNAKAWDRGDGRHGLDMGRDMEGAHGWTGSWGKKMNGAGEGEKRRT